ncbi:unnamed protein product [Rotaria sp. Silwood1]|nr:unnamed protein product [Rotaria sp. Silwood1]CAF0859913.1 unnamed protein product [Rotaria sp. Silwood1]CAF3355422.1 unnamed protein product [Rotaria sp. Silwood1]CAF4677014.1 unnamed protein product [Rotaria sp. Silwood1]
MKEDINFANVDWKILNDYLPEKLLEELDEEHDTNIHQRLSVTSRQTYGDLASESRATYSDPLQNQHHSDQISTNSIHQLDLESLSNDRYLLESFIQPINNFDWNSECHRTNMRNEIIKRFLTAMSVDYEKQWCLGMIRQRTLKILIETIEEAKAKLSLKRHWQLLTKRFSFHSAKSHLENMLTKFPEFANIDNDVMNSVLNEARMLQVRASLVLHDLQHSYKKCWAIEMTKRCAQMLLKHESVAIVQLYETGMLNENEYAHILKLIQKKLFHLEYSHLMGIPKIHLNREQDNPFNYLSLFADLTENEKAHFKELLETRHRWFQPGEVLLRQGYITSEAYLIIRGIVECSEDLLTCYRAGHIIGIDALFDKTSSASNRTYRAESSIVEAYTIDESILNMFLSNVKMTRLIYNEIALHMLINMYQEPVNLLNYAQIKVLLDEYAIFYQNEIDHDIMTIQLRRNERLFLLIGTIQREDDDYFIDGPQLVTVNQSTSFHCIVNKLCIAYTWTLENEQECLQIVRSFTTSFRLSDSSQVKANTTMVYPSYSGYTTEFTPQCHSLIQVARSAAHMSNIELIPMEITDLYHEKI